MNVNSTPEEVDWARVIFTNVHLGATARKLLKLHYLTSAKDDKFPQLSNGIMVFGKKSTTEIDFLSKKPLFLTYFVQYFEQDACVPL